MTFIGCSHRSSNVSVHRRRTISLKSFLCFRYPISFFLFFFFFVFTFVSSEERKESYIFGVDVGYIFGYVLLPFSV